MTTEQELQSRLQSRLDETMGRVNEVLQAKNVGALKPVLSRIGKGQQLPHWYEQLAASGTLPNLDGKTVGSVIEMLLVGVLETWTFADMKIPPLRINPARGVDLPDVGLGVKSPSENYCTSEPYFSAYERLLGSGHDVLVLLTDYQKAKKNPPLRLQIIKWRYLRATQIADENLCRIAKKHRGWLVQEDVARAQRLFRFLAYVNQSDWRAKRILKMCDHINDEKALGKLIDGLQSDFLKSNKQLLKKNQIPIEETELEALQSIAKITPLKYGVIDAAENWLVEVCKDTARPANESEWKKLLVSPLEGIIGMSLALQWRYNFGRLFKTKRLRGSQPK